MDTIIDLVVFGTFGTPNGFTQSSILRNIYKTFDLNTNAIVLFPKTKIYSIRKEILDRQNIISYSIYTFAKEKHSERGGTFIGSNISFFNKIANENLTINSLNEFHQDLISNNINISNDVIQVSHSNKIKVNKPIDLDKIDFNLRPIEDLDFAQISNKSLVVYSEVNSNKLQKLFKQAIDLLNIYDTIYFTGSKEIAEFVHQKGLFKLVKGDGFEQEIKYLEIERKRKIELSIQEFEKEKENLEIDRKRLIDDYNYQIENNEKLHQENKRKIDQSKKEVIVLGDKYDVYKRKIDESINQLKSGKKLDQVKQLQNENKRIFIDSINQKKLLNFINIPEPNAQISLRTSSHQKRYEDINYTNKQNHAYHKEDKLNIFKVAFFFLLLLLIGLATYFLFFFIKEDSIKISSYPTTQEKIIENPKPIQKIVKELNPVPSGILNIDGYRLIANKIKKDMNIEEVVKVIFENNSQEISQIYIGQEKEYAENLKKLNEVCFKQISNMVVFVSDTIRNIPKFKK